jgi:RNA polymerase-binding transcription factor DksA
MAVRYVLATGRPPVSIPGRLRLRGASCRITTPTDRRSKGMAGLTQDQRRHLERRLQEERDRAQAIVRRYEQGNESGEDTADGDLSHYPFHLADQGSDSYDQEMSAQLAQRASRELEEIDEALARLYEHPEHFGISETTGRPIPFERLDLIPWARTGAEGT